jgi:hypothetical protein
MLNLKQTVEDDLNRSRGQSDYLVGAKSSFVKDAIHFDCRDDFDTYMKDIEKQYFSSIELPHTPYVYE